MPRFVSLLTVVIVAFMLTGCVVLRGIPTHGGGKRFDEEQRVVSGAVRRAVADMDLLDLTGRSVVINVVSIAHNGGGYQTYPGITGVSGAYNRTDADADGVGYTNYAVAGNPYVQTLTGNTNWNVSKNWSVNGQMNPSYTYNASTYPSDSDLDYLRAVVTMKAQHDGLLVVNPGEPVDYQLDVLVDVFGINRSRADGLIWWRDRELASCEITYYAISAALPRHLFFSARSTSGMSSYTEYSFIGFTGFKIKREIQSLAPTSMPVTDRNMLLISQVVKPTTTTLPTAATAPPEKIDQSVKEYLDTRIRMAELQLDAGNADEAARLIDSVRALDPNHPRLADIESRIARLRQAQTTNSTKEKNSLGIPLISP